ncbi:MAG: sterol desaturase family protein [Winogradskyella sp.]|nr:sterol desaturase family protein [Winogradskyella sp.]
METLYTYFETIPSSHRSLILVSGITFFWLLEGALPLFKYDYKKWKHAIPNFFFTMTTIVINFGLAFILLWSSDWVKANDFGIINWLPEMPLWSYIFLGVLFLDFFGAYLAHLVEHKVKPLWMVHLVHHTDHKVDTTTANRHHPIESVIRFTFTLLGVFAVGTPIAIVMLYQALSLIFTQFTHANIKLPKAVDRLISYVLISPDMHKIHHHYRLPYTDSNYGNIFSIWDRVFGTYMYMEREKLVYGVDVFPNEIKNSNISELLKQPFQAYEKPTFTEGIEYNNV